jgi:hypothetical protein
MKSWKTSISGLVAAVLMALAVQFPEYKTVLETASAFSVALLGFFSKDKGTTGVQ